MKLRSNCQILAQAVQAHHAAAESHEGQVMCVQGSCSTCRTLNAYLEHLGWQCKARGCRQSRCVNDPAQ